MAALPWSAAWWRCCGLLYSVVALLWRTSCFYSLLLSASCQLCSNIHFLQKQTIYFGKYHVFIVDNNVNLSSQVGTNCSKAK
jgi:hypothetical protein